MTTTANIPTRDTILQDDAYDTALALIGMSGRFPGAENIKDFWRNIIEGIKAIRYFTDEELLAAGVSPADLQQPNYVKAGAILEQIDQFDAAFFGYSPREAEAMDPQHRLFLECAWEALEDAAYTPENQTGLTGVFAGTAISTYLLNNIYSDTETLQRVGKLQASIGNDKDSLATAVSYKLNLKGPSFAVQTFCSTSLVAVHLACQSLLNFECDMALAGGVAISVPQKTGYFYEEGGIVSPDGVCRTFDAHGNGSVMGNGVGVVVLKRLKEAIENGDHIYATIRGSAINNDGSMRVSYTAPGLDGQTEVIAEAIGNAGVAADTISYIEAHGTATELGDAVELAAMIKAFETRTDKKGFCALGSVKPNIGHLDRASGVTGLIKTALALHHQEIPPSLNFEQTHTDIDLANSSFYVNTRRKQWEIPEGTARRAGVSSFGLGGTNVHVIVEEAPIEKHTHRFSRPWQLLLLSARSESALNTQTQKLAEYLQQQPEIDLADVAYTLQVGRTIFDHRRLLLVSNNDEAITALAQAGKGKQAISVHDPFRERKVAFLFPGLGEAYIAQAQELYRCEPVFQQYVDRCCAFLQATQNLDLTAIFQASGTSEQQSTQGIDLKAMLKRGPVSSQPFTQTRIAQPAIFILEYALAQLLQTWGIQPAILLGYSLGEYVAACLAGVFSLEDALTLVTKRAQLLEMTEAGSMLAVSLGEQTIQPYLSQEINLAVINSPTTCVLSGSPSAIEQLEHLLTEQEIAYQRVATRHAFHSSLMEPVKEQLTALVRTIDLQPPAVPYISNVTGRLITEQDATDPTYWARHLCQTVQFASGIQELVQDHDLLLLEVGPGQALSSFVKQYSLSAKTTGVPSEPLVFSTMPAVYERQSAYPFLLMTLGKLWLAGVTIDWASYYQEEERRRISLPTYPFERQRYWIEASPQKAKTMQQANSAISTTELGIEGELERLADISDWFYLPSWKQTLPHEPYTDKKYQHKRYWLIFLDQCGIGQQLGKALQQQHEVIYIKPGEQFSQDQEQHYKIRPDQREDYEKLLDILQQQNKMPTDIVHLWTVTPPAQTTHEQALQYGFYSLLALAQSLGSRMSSEQEACQITIVSNETQDVSESEPLSPAKAAVTGPCRVIPQEYTQLICRCIDITVPSHNTKDRMLTHLLGEITSESSESMIALRGNRRWIQTFEPVKLHLSEQRQPHLRHNGVYLITGGTGGIGLAMAEELVKNYQARLILTSRTGLPPREQWSHLLESPDTKETLKHQIQTIQHLEEHGPQLQILAADVSNETQMREVLQKTLDTYGTLHGILHTAGVPGVGLMQLKTAEQAAQVLAPKITGTLVLEHILKEYPQIQLDFLVLFSSMSSITGGGPGQVDYSAANAFLDTYARTHQHEHGKTIAIGWGEWQWNAWEAGLAGYDRIAQNFFRTHRQTFGITFSEGAEALKRILATQLPHVIVSTQEFCAFAEMSKAFTAASILQRTQAQKQQQTRHARPDLGTSYITPRNEIEKRIAAIWEDLLGIESIGIDDNFFELGGNSLTGVDLMARLRKAFQNDQLAAHILYEAPTISALAQYIEPQQSLNEKAEEWDARSEKRRGGLRQRIRETGRTR